MKPYEPDIARVRAMYRLPTAPAPGRVLELYVGTARVLFDGPWAGSTATLAPLTDPFAELPFGPDAFDVVVLHRTLEPLLANPAVRAPDALAGLFGRIRAVLARNGVVAGCLHTGARRVGGYRITYRGLAAALARAGFERISTYNVLPSGDAPTRLIDTRAPLSRIGFRRELDALRAHLRWPGYLARRAVTELALSRYLEPWLAFYGRRP